MTRHRQGVTIEDLDLVDAVARFAQTTLAPRAAALDATEGSCLEHVPALGAMGLLGLNLPIAYGGPGASPAALLLALVEVSKHCAATSSMIGAHYLGTDAVLLGGSDAQRQRLLPPAASGEHVYGFALTEPGGGSHPADLTTRASRDGEVYHLHGSKQFISNAGAADRLVVFAKTDPAGGARGVSALVVDATAAGVVVGPPEKTMGIRSAPAHPVRFEGVRVPVANRLGEEGSGFRLAMRVLDNSRLDVVATALGIAEAALALTHTWLQERRVGGEPLAHKQGVQWMVADMKVRLEAAWALAMQAVARRASGEPYSLESAMAKLYASEMVGFVVDTALQLHGGYGYTRALPLERMARDARILRIYEGASEIQRTIIARAVLGVR
jgi:alkylation response protein AidB-like acyl-CoA dehydrogenase